MVDFYDVVEFSKIQLFHKGDIRRYFARFIQNWDTYMYIRAIKENRQLGGEDGLRE